MLDNKQVIAETIANREAEESVIGCLLTNGKLMTTAYLELTEQMFHFKTTKTIFAAMVKLYEADKKIDPLLILERIKKSERDRYKQELLSCMQAVPSTANYRSYFDLVKETYNKGVAFETAQRMIDHIINGNDMLAIREEASKIVESIDGTKSAFAVNTKQAFTMFATRQQEKPDYIKTGFSKIDDAVFIEQGDYVIVGGLPSSGKTAITLQFASTIALEKRVVYYSIETSANKIIDRLMSHNASISMKSIKKRTMSELEWERYGKVGGKFVKQMDFQIVEAAGMTTHEIEADAVKRKADVIFIDYLGLIKTTGSGRFEQVTNISLDIKRMCVSRKITVFALSQLSRKAAGGNTTPDMSHLRESGQLEQDADSVIMIDRFKEQIDEHTETWVADRRNLIIPKNKDGENIMMEMYFNGEMQTFSELSMEEY